MTKRLDASAVNYPCESMIGISLTIQARHIESALLPILQYKYETKWIIYI